MIKPERLRELLTQTISHFISNPEKLILQYGEGQIYATGGKSLSFEYAYPLEVIAIDFPLHPDVFFVPILAFLHTEQQELLHNPEYRGKIIFEIDSNNNNTYDIYIRLPLTERVIVKENNGSYQAKHANEPQLTDHQPLKKWNLQVFVKGEEIYNSERMETGNE